MNRSDETEDNSTYKVVIDHEGQYSIWPADREAPLGWKDAGKTGPKRECLDYIDNVRPGSRPARLDDEAGDTGGERGGGPM